MTGFVRKATLFSVCGVLAAATAMAAVPSPATSVCPGCSGPGSARPFLKYVGEVTPGSNNFHVGLTAPADPRVTITVKDFAGNPVAGSIVELNSTNCTDLKLCNRTVTGVTQTVDCTNKVIRGTTNALGQVTLIGIGGGLNNGVPGTPTPGPGLNCVQIVADGIPLANATAVIYDENGAVLPLSAGRNGVDVLDLSKFQVDLLSGTYFGRSDFSHIIDTVLFPSDADGCSGPAPDCGGLNVADLSLFSKHVLFAPGGTGSVGGCSANAGETAFNYCP